MHKGNIEVRFLQNCCRGKSISVNYSKCVSVALVTQHTKRMRSSILACPAVQYFSQLSQNGAIFGEELLNIKHSFRFSLQICLKHFSL